MTSNAFESEFKGCVLLFSNACLKLNRKAIIIFNKTEARIVSHKQLFSLTNRLHVMQQPLRNVDY